MFAEFVYLYFVTAIVCIYHFNKGVLPCLIFRSSSATLFIVVGGDGTGRMSVDGESGGLVGQLLQLPMSGTRLMVVVGFVLGLCVVVVAVCISVCAYRLQQRRHKLDAASLKGTVRQQQRITHMSQSYEASPAVWDHSVACHLKQMNASHHNSSHTNGTRFIYPGGMEG